MRHHPRAVVVLPVVLLLAVVGQGTITAASDESATAALTPLNTNLLANGGFSRTPTDSSPIPQWSVTGRMHTETFGTRRWPDRAYGRKYNGGARYLACGGEGGVVRQTVDLVGLRNLSYRLKSRLSISFGGLQGHRIRISLRATGSGPEGHITDVKKLEVTNHYKKVVASLVLQPWHEHLEATIRLMPRRGSTNCRMMADTARLILFRP
jgi:hypothetical protein